jgi:hypothetical protein
MEQEETFSVRDNRSGNWLWLTKEAMEIAVLAKDKQGKQRGALGLAVYCAICSFANRNQKAWPSIDKLSKTAGLGRQETGYILHDLANAGLIHLAIDPGRQSVITLLMPTRLPDNAGCLPDNAGCLPDNAGCLPDNHKQDTLTTITNKNNKQEASPTQFFDEKPANNDKNSTEPIFPVSVNSEPFDLLANHPIAGPLSNVNADGPVLSVLRGFGYPSKSSPVAVAQRKVDALVKKATKQTASEAVAGWPPYVEEKVTAYVHAYFRGVAPDGANVRKPDAVTLIKQNEYVMEINSTVFSPKDFEDAARYYWRAWKGMLSLKRLTSELSEWDARGRPKAKVAEQRGVTKNYAEIAAAEQTEWERLGRPAGWVPT